METINALKRFLTDDQIVEVADMALSGRNLEAAMRLRYLLIDKWHLPLTEATAICRKLAEEFSK